MAKSKPTVPAKQKTKSTTASGERTIVDTNQASVVSPPLATRPDTQPFRIPKSAAFAAGILIGLIALVPIVRYYDVVWHNAVNVPFEDDFNSTLQFITNYAFHSQSLASKWRLIFAQHNEHRIAFDRLVFLVDYAIGGHVNFRNQILFGNLSLVFVFWLLFAASFRQVTLLQKLFYFLPVPFLLFQLHFWELTVWGMASIQNLYIVVFSLLSLYALSRVSERPAWFLMACLSAVAAAFTSGNGMFTFLVGIPFLVLTKNYRKLGIWTGIAAVTIFLYFWGYAKPGHHPPVLETFLTNSGQFLDHFFTLTGSNFSAKPNQPILAGKWMLALALGIPIYVIYQKRLAGSNLTLFMLLAFMYISCLSVSAGRAGFGVAQAMGPRYGILSVMLLISLYILCVETATNRYVKPALTIAGLGLAFYLYTNSYKQHLSKVADRTANLEFSVALYNDNPDNLILYWGDPKLAKKIFQDALKKGIYQIPALTLANLKSQPIPLTGATLTPTNDVAADVKPYPTHDFLVMYQAWAVNSQPSNETQIQLVAQSAQNNYAFDTRRQIRYDVANQYQSTQFLQAGFSCVIRKSDLKPGHYTLGVRLITKGVPSYLPLTDGFDV
ncbi:hypothetical protein [Spirosoma utsteinense]|uniref:Glycosyltransferase RgtA/B/C/D-like domain-containing protein n=1 Tax=Spirosoma utsteinense TaxID=2585773 RepID=A0ABR6W0J1_9BACT|nr:hypothetical protein [Spirosoma utsteinense]MBC3783786.1 hypothetical protein [Spirosoma utsteinense]MBC3790070.1 hypothetical protein [Spirosoma utsteinense]